MARGSKNIRRVTAIPAAANAKVRKQAERGVSTSNDFKLFMTGLMTDVVLGRIQPQLANAACNAGGRLLKVVEMEYKYGRKAGQSVGRLALTD